MTLALQRTLEITQELIIKQWTVKPAITQVVAVQTRSGLSAPEVSWTRQIITVFFVQVVHTVVYSIAACVDRQAVSESTRTLVMAIRTRLIKRHFCFKKYAKSIKIDLSRGRWMTKSNGKKRMLNV